MKISRKTAAKVRQPTKRAPTAPRLKPAARRTTKTPASPSAARPQPQHTSKAAQVLAALHQPQGATLGELMQATGWQAHSVRGFLSGTVRKRLNQPLLTEVTAAGRRYRLAEAPAT